MASQDPFETHKRLIQYIARRVLMRVRAAGGASVQYDDIFQELCVAWCQARDLWDETLGVPFGAYLMRGMSHHINRWVSRELRQRTMAPIDLDAELLYGDGEGDTFHDHCADANAVSPEDVVIANDLHDFMCDDMRWRSPRKGKIEALLPETTQFLNIMANPPHQLLELVEGIRVRAAYGRSSLGLSNTFAHRDLTAGLVFDAMGLDKPTRNAVKKQLAALEYRVSQQ